MRSNLPRHSLAWAARLGVLMVAGFGLLAISHGCQSTETAAEKNFEQLVGRAPSGQAETAARRGALWYHIDARGERLDIHVRLADPPERASFFLPGAWAGRADFADNISIKGASSEDGPVPFTISRSEGRIDVESQGARWVQLSYAVKLRQGREQMARFHPQFSDGVLFAYGPAFIVLPSEQISRQVRDIPVEVRAPAKWRLLATWKHMTSTASKAVEDSTVHGFVAPTPGALRDAFVAAGASIDVHTPPVAEPNSALAVGFSPGVEVDREAYSRRIGQIVDAYRERFGDLGPVTAYVRPIDGAHIERGRGVGRRGGFVVEVPADQPLDDKATLLLAHEAFHLWNGHHLTPEPSAEAQTRWFKEGVTHYVALKLLAELGLFSRADVLRELAQAASFYQRNPAARRRPSSTAHRARLPYDKGVLLGFALDSALLSESGERVGLADWISLLVEEMGDRADAYTANDLRAALLEVSGATGTRALSIWDAHVGGTKPLDPAQIFDAAGLHWLEGEEHTKARLLPIERARSPFQKMFPTKP